jgi:L-lactate permease
MAGSLAYGFSRIGPWFIIVAPIIGWIGVALSGSNTSTNAMFGAFQVAVGKVLGFPPLLLPTLNSVESEVGKPVAPQTASLGVSTSRFVRGMDAYPPDLSDSQQSVVLPVLSGRNVHWLGLTTPNGSDQGCKGTLRTAKR